ncbi:substrate-binding domain-containing protein [Sphingopyxis sp. SE2]|uniref:substrate-binding domain-containing protein n=1 Tax=Sphingopyxis sp. SE2 TaxID=1586240 RepID=UPI0028C1A114|nr:substrate-binding domain-containing protein [Sphingopyxis sp. SE2]MDT7530582.1 substrate-binding domain-containing protein [Sphingopyxis sp. SE2]
MKTIADLSGVSTITVSRALRGSELVRPEVREHVTQIARHLGYRMNVAARNLRTRESRTIAVAIDHELVGRDAYADPLVLSMIGGLLEVLTPAGYSMLLTTSEHFASSGAVGVDGAVILGQGANAGRVNETSNLTVPTVIWGEPPARGKTVVVGSDNHMGGALAAEHLVDGGASRILFLGDTRHPEVAARLAGLRQYLESTDAHLVATLPAQFSHSGGFDATCNALNADISFDAVFAASDAIAAGACDALITQNVLVPAEVAIIGFDDAPIASLHRPSISSIRQSGAEGGRTLGATILSLIEGGEPGHVPALPVSLVPRDSSSKQSPNE